MVEFRQICSYCTRMTYYHPLVKWFLSRKMYSDNPNTVAWHNVLKGKTKMIPYHRSSGSSVTRLDGFWNLLVTNVLTKVAQMYVDFFESINFHAINCWRSTFGQHLEIFGLLYISASGHTGGKCTYSTALNEYEDADLLVWILM